MRKRVSYCTSTKGGWWAYGRAKQSLRHHIHIFNLLDKPVYWAPGKILPKKNLFLHSFTLKKKNPLAIPSPPKFFIFYKNRNFSSFSFHNFAHVKWQDLFNVPMNGDILRSRYLVHRSHHNSYCELQSLPFCDAKDDELWSRCIS